MPTEVVAIAYEDRGGADRAADALRQARDDNQVAVEEVAVVTLDEDGNVHATIRPPEVSQRVGGGTVGALIGGVVGAFIGPIGAIAGLAIGGGIGAHEAVAHGEVDDDFLQAVGESLRDGGSALVIAAQVEELEWLSGHVPDELRGRLVRTSLSDSEVERMRELGANVAQDASTGT